MDKKQFYILENLKSTQEGKPSPSGKWQVSIESYSTKEGCWHYTLGKIINTETKEEALSISRNYSTFYHDWIVYKNKEYLMCSSNYMGQTCADPESQHIANWEPSDENFCWSGPWAISPDEKTLAICGCWWAAPYEVKFYDISDGIMNIPLKEIEVHDDIEGKTWIPDMDLEKEKHNIDLEYAIRKEYGEEWYENEEVYKKFLSEEKSAEIEIKWNEDGSFSTTGAIRVDDKMFIKTKKTE